MDPIAMEKTMKRNREIARQELQDALDKITIKEVVQLTKYERGFLRARWTYLKPEEKDKFQSLIEKSKKLS